MSDPLVRGRYELLDVVGRGGQGEVARALDHQHDRVVALKIREVGSEFERQALLRESRVLLKLSPHPGLPVVREDFFVEDRYFIVMDWVDGVGLARILDDRGSPGLPPTEVVEYVSQAADALDHLHRQQPPVVHLDVKPGNLILVPDGRVVLVDFGLSGASPSGGFRRHGGTRGFTAPELAAGTATPAADVFGLAATAFALLTGERPRGDPPTWENVPRGVAGRIEPVIRQALSIDPERRHPSAGAFASELAAAVGAPSEVRPSERPTEIRTFLIADVRGYTRFTQEHGDEAAARLAETFAEITREGVEARGGRVIELRGDEALAGFTSARQAMRAAVELQQVFDDESRLEASLPLQVGIGLDAGEAVPVEEGFRGAALNLAARLCANAGPGEVLASQGVVHLVGRVDGLALEELGPVQLKGLAEPAPVWRVVAGAARTQPAASPVGPGSLPDLPHELDPLTPLVGRDRDARWIRWNWRLARHGPGRGVVITGSEGSGKTLLAAEAAALAIRGAGWVGYASAIGSGADVAKALEAFRAAPDPGLLVLDDLHAADQQELGAIGELFDGLPGRRSLLVALLRDDAPPRIRATLERLVGAGDGLRRLGPLDRDGVRAVAALYAEEVASEIPVEAILQATGGAPQGVHEMAVRWAEGEAARRLGEAAARTARGRAGLRAVETELTGSVIELQLVRERGELFGGKEERPAADTPPFKGLASFDVADAPFFFGRERLVAEMVARLAGSPFLAVVGPSGSGKSSAVRAGLVPALAAGALPGSEEWIRVLLRPGGHPERELDRAVYAALPERMGAELGSSAGTSVAVLDLLSKRRGHMLLVVDQFEEAFTACGDEDERRRFVDMLAAAARRSGITVVLAVRADFYGRCAEHPDLAELLGGNHVLVGPMTAEEYRRAIELPARRAGLRIDRPLVDALVGEVVDEPGGLPLLSTALLELWLKRDGRAIRLQAYAETGGVRGAVARLAEEAFGALTDEQQKVARAVLLRLSTGEGEAVARRRVPLEEFDPETNPDVGRVLDALTGARLLTVDEGAVEVAHEALLREWPRLRGWLEEDRVARRLREHLTEQSKEWEGSARDAGDLYRGARLASALDWAADHDVELNELERAFLDESRKASVIESERQRRTNRRLRGLLAGVAVFLVLALVAGGLALAQRGRARGEAERAESQARVATARELANAAVVNLDDDPELSILLALEAVETTRSAGGSVLPEAEEVLHRAVVASRIDVRLDGAGHAGDWSPDGSLIATGGAPDEPGAVALRDANTGEVLRSWQAHDSRVNDLAFSPDGSLLATAGDDGTMALWDPSDGRLVRILAGPKPTDRVWAITFAPDGRLVAAIWWDSGRKTPVDPITRIFDKGEATARILEVRSGRRVRSIPGLEGVGRYVPEAMAFSPDGSRLAVADGDTAIRVIGVATGRVEQVLDPEPGTFGTAPDVAWRPVGHLLAPASDRGVAIWKPGSAAPLFEIETGTEAIAWSPDGSRLATLGGDKARVWELIDEAGHLDDAGHLVLTLPARDVVQVGWESLAFSPDGARLLVSSNEGDAVIWDVGVGGDAEWLNVAAQKDWRGDVAYSPDGKAIVGTVLPRSATIWDAATGEALLTFEGHDPAEIPGVAGVAFSPDGTLVATGARDMNVKVWRADTGEEVFTFSGHTGWLEDLEFSPDGTLLATASQDGTARIIDVGTGQANMALEHPDQVTSVAFAPDGRSLATASYDGFARLWDASDGSLLAAIDTGFSLEAVDLSPDGALLAVGAKDGTGSVWDVATETRVATLAGHAGELWAVAFSPDGSLVATGSTDFTVRLWDPLSGVPRLVLRGHRDSVRNVAFSPDGSRLATISGDGTIRVWALDPADLIGIAERELTRTFTEEECRQYLHVDACPA